MASTITFAVFAVVATVAAWRVVTTRDVVRAALALMIVLGAMAPIFILLAAEFVAVVQVLVYVGAVVVLLLFGIMLTRSPETGEKEPGLPRRFVIPAIALALGMFAALTLVALRAGFPKLNIDGIGRTEAVGDLLLRQYVVPFEVLSVLLLVTLVGAVVLARRD